MVFNWLKDISINGKKFHKLQEEGRLRIKKRIAFLNKSLKELDTEEIELDKDIEKRVSELVKTKVAVVKETIEKSIVKLNDDKKVLKAKRLYIEYEIEELQKLFADGKDLFKDYSKEIKATINNDSARLKERLKNLISFIRLGNSEIKLALSGVNLKEPVSAVSGLAPRDKQQANRKIELITDKIQLPKIWVLRNKSYIERLYCNNHLSIREIARKLNVSHSSVFAAIKRYGSLQQVKDRKRKGQIPFGFEYINYQLLKKKDEQEVIRMIRQLKENGLSLREIADKLNNKLIPTKNNGIWHANTIRKILLRNGNYKIVQH